MPLLLALPLLGGTMVGLFELIDLYLEKQEQNSCSANDGVGLDEVGKTFGKGFLSGSVGTLAGLGAGVMTGNPFAGGAAGAATSNAINQAMSGSSFSASSMALSALVGAGTAGMASKLIPMQGRVPSLVLNRSMNNYGPNSVKMLARKTVSGVTGGSTATVINKVREGER